MRYVIVTVIALAVIAGAAGAGTKVAVLDFKNFTPQDGEAWLSVAAPKLLGAKLSQVAGIEIVDLDTPGKMPDTPPADANEIAKPAVAAGAKIGIGGRVFYSEKEVRLAAVIVDAQPEFLSKHYPVIGEVKAVGPPDKMMSLVSDLAVLILEKIGAKPTDAELARIRRDPTTNRQALQLAASGIEHQRAGEYEKALASYDSALAADPGFAQMQGAAAGALMYLGRADEAAKRMEAAVGIVPDDPTMRMACALSLLMAGRAKDAIPHVEEAARLAPNNPEIPLWTAHLLSVMGDPAAALEKCRAVLQGPGLDPESFLIPFAARFSFSPGPGVFAARIPHQVLAAMVAMGAGGGPEIVIVRSVLADQMCFVVGRQDGSLPDIQWLHKHAQLIVDGSVYRPNLMGRLLAALNADDGGGEDFGLVCFDAAPGGVPVITDDTKAITLAFDELAGARREFTWVGPAESERCMLQQLAPLIAGMQEAAPEVTDSGEDLMRALLASLRVDAHGDAPLGAFWLPPSVGTILEREMANARNDEAWTKIMADISEKVRANLFFILISPTLGEFQALPLDQAAASAKIAVDAGAPIAPRAVDLPFANDLTSGLSDDGKHTVKLVAFPALDESGSPIFGDGSKRLVLTVRGFAGAPERVFTWELPEKPPASIRDSPGE
jgi:tetratricopeptide (TPR) repeat protein